MVTLEELSLLGLQNCKVERVRELRGEAPGWHCTPTPGQGQAAERPESDRWWLSFPDRDC